MKRYCYILIPFITLLICQILKFIIESWQNKKSMWSRLFYGAGGMPSAHTSFSFSLVFTLGYQEGFTSPFFAIALIFSMIVSYDAMGVRLETERQAIAINQLLDYVFKNQPEKRGKILKEELGHLPLEVFAGIIFAFIVSTFLNIFL